MGLELTTDRYPPITNQTRYPLRHAASDLLYIIYTHVVYLIIVFAFYILRLPSTCIYFTPDTLLDILVKPFMCQHVRLSVYYMY